MTPANSTAYCGVFSVSKREFITGLFATGEAIRALTRYGREGLVADLETDERELDEVIRDLTLMRADLQKLSEAEIKMFATVTGMRVSGVIYMLNKTLRMLRTAKDRGYPYG